MSTHVVPLLDPCPSRIKDYTQVPRLCSSSSRWPWRTDKIPHDSHREEFLDRFARLLRICAPGARISSLETDGTFKEPAKGPTEDSGDALSALVKEVTWEEEIAVDRLCRSKRFSSEREPVEFLFGLYERLRASLEAKMKTTLRRRRIRRKSIRTRR